MGGRLVRLSNLSSRDLFNMSSLKTLKYVAAASPSKPLRKSTPVAFSDDMQKRFSFCDARSISFMFGDEGWSLTKRRRVTLELNIFP